MDMFAADKDRKQEEGEVGASGCEGGHQMTMMIAAVTMIADIYISISMETFEHREYKSRGEDGNK